MQDSDSITMDNEKKMPPTEVRAADVAFGATEDTVPPQQLPFAKKMLMYLWDADQHLKSPEERKLVRKLDFGILICATLGWWMKYIDQSNITNAYVSGMKEDLNIQGNEYTYMLSESNSATHEPQLTPTLLA